MHRKAVVKTAMNLQVAQNKLSSLPSEQLTAVAGLQFSNAVRRSLLHGSLNGNRFVMRLVIYTTAPTAYVTCDASPTGDQYTVQTENVIIQSQEDNNKHGPPVPQYASHYCTS